MRRLSLQLCLSLFLPLSLRPIEVVGIIARNKMKCYVVFLIFVSRKAEITRLHLGK